MWMKTKGIIQFPNKILCNIYVFIWVLYAFHWHEYDFMFPVLGSLSNLFLAINLGVSIYCMLYCISHYKMPRLYYSMNILLFLFVLYGVFSILFGGDIFIGKTGSQIKNGSYLIGALRTFLPFYAFFYFTKKGCLTEKMVGFWGWIIMFQCIYFIWLFSSYRSFGYYTYNGAYLMVSVLPCIFFMSNKKLIQWMILIFILLVTFLSMKRGAMVTAGLFFLFYVYRETKDAKKWRKAVVWFAVAALFVWGAIFVYNTYEGNELLQAKVEATETGDSSGRDELAQNIMNVYLSESSLFQFLFGYGADGTLKIGENYAHNDWLEMLVDMGVLGFIAYLFFWITFFRESTRKDGNTLRQMVLIGALAVMFPRTLFSMLYSNMEISISMPVAFCMAFAFLETADNHYLGSNKKVNRKNR